MKKTAWGLGLATALALVAGQVQAQTSPQGSTSDTSHGSMGSRTGGGSTNSGTGSTAGAGASTGEATSSGHFDELSGKVQRFDRSNNELTLTGSPQPLKVDSSTQVMRDGARASIDDIKEGDQVRASFSGSADTPTVNRIDITSSKKSSTPRGGGNAPSGNSLESMGTGSSSSGSGNAPSGNTDTTKSQ